MIRSETRVRMSGLTALVLMLTSLQFACSWISVSSPPQYRTPNPLPLTVGVELSGSRASQDDGPRVVSLLQEMKVFQSMTYPHRADDTVDGILFLSIDGTWKAQQGRNFWSGILIGLSLFTLSPFLGASMIGTYEAEATLSNGSKNITHVATQTVSRIKWGLLADTDEVAAKGTDLQVRTIAVELARAIESDRSKILAEYSETHSPAQPAPGSPNPSTSTQHQPERSDEPNATRSVADELERLANLRSKGLISEEEFAKAKLRLLGN